MIEFAFWPCRTKDLELMKHLGICHFNDWQFANICAGKNFCGQAWRLLHQSVFHVRQLQMQHLLQQVPSSEVISGILRAIAILTKVSIPPGNQIIF